MFTQKDRKWGPALALAMAVTFSPACNCGRASPLELEEVVLGETTVGARYRVELYASGGTAPRGFETEGLPAGLVLDASSGVIEGAATEAGDYNVTLRVTDARQQSQSRGAPLKVFPAPRITTTALAAGNVGTAYQQGIQAEGGKAPLSLSIVGGALPPGLTLAEGTGVASGTPTAHGSFSFVVKVTDAHGASTQATLTISIFANAPPRVVTDVLRYAVAGRSHSDTLAAAAGVPPYQWSVVSGSLPAGLTLSADGVLSGTPPSSGTASFEVKVVDVKGQSATKMLTLTVTEPLRLNTASLPDGYIGESYATTLAASGGLAPQTWSMSGGTLPPGISLSSSGALAGAPTGAGSFTFTVSVADGSGQVMSAGLAITTYTPPAITTSTLPNGSVGAAYSQAIATSGGKAPRSLRVSSGSLPAGLTLSGSTLGGTPTRAQVANFTLEVIDANGRTGTRTFAITIYEGLAITTSSVPDAYTGRSYQQMLGASGGAPPYAWSIASGGLPPGITLAADGTLGGTPTATGSFSFTAQVRDGSAQSATKPFTLSAYAPPSVTTSRLPDGYTNDPYAEAIAASGGKAPLTFSVSAGTLPPGLTLASDGSLSGTPALAADSTITVSVVDANGISASRPLVLSVLTPPSISTSALPDGYTSEFYFETLVGAGGRQPYSFQVTAGAPPMGMTLASDGTLSGQTSASASPSFSVRLADANGKNATAPFTLAIYDPPNILTMSLPSGTLGVVYSQTLMASGGKAPLTWSVSGGELPPGLTVSSTGVIAGTPTQAGSWMFSLHVADANGRPAVSGLTLLISAPPADGGTAYVWMANWNLEWFGSTSGGPTDEVLQMANARDVIQDGGYEIWGLVEIVSSSQFANLVSQLPGYQGLLATDPSVTGQSCDGFPCYTAGEQKPALLYKGSVATLQGAQLILRGTGADGGDYDYWFAGRPPLRVDLRVTQNGVTADVVVIVLHLKANTGTPSSDWQRRQLAAGALKDYLDSYLPTQKVIVLGDWNDDVDRSISSGFPTPFANFNGAPFDYRYVTAQLSDAGVSSTVSYSDFIDHQLVTNELLDNYVLDSAQVVRADFWIPSYASTTSDHYPVASEYDLAAGGTTPPSDGGVDAGVPPRVFVNEVLYTETRSLPDGGRNFAEEFVEVVNAGSSPVNLTGWTLWDSSAPRHGFDAGTLLMPGKAIVVFSGASAIPPGLTNAVVASSGTLSLHPADTVSLRNDVGTWMDSHSWSFDQTPGVSANRWPDGDPDAGFAPHDWVSPGWLQSPGARANGAPY